MFVCVLEVKNEGHEFLILKGKVVCRGNFLSRGGVEAKTFCERNRVVFVAEK